ncbi:MAG: iron dependent repressor, metal binding and dimerization domain protein [archaeon]
MDKKQAHKEACKIEHAVSRETVEKLALFMKK